MKGVIDFYRQPPKGYRHTFHPGQFFIAPIPFVIGEEPNRLRCEHYDPAKPGETRFELVKTDLITYKPEDDPTLRFIGVPSDSFLLALGYKRRRVILVSDPIASPVQIAHGYSGYLVIPLYSLHDDAGNYKENVDRRQILRAMAYQIGNVFYLPASEEYGIRESFARLDRMQFARIEHLSPTPIALTEEASNLLREWTWNYLGAPLFNKALEDFMAASAEAIRKELGEEGG